MQTQVRTSFGGVVGLDYTAVLAMAEVYGWEITPYDMDGLQALEYDMLEQQAANSKPKDEMAR